MKKNARESTPSYIPLSEEQRDAAARKLCELRGFAPDRKIFYVPDVDPETGKRPLIPLYVSAFNIALLDIERAEQVAQALQAGQAQTPPEEE